MPKNRHKKTHKQNATKAQPAGDAGLQCFRRGEYTEAIAHWEKHDPSASAAVRAALAEAHFRRGLNARRDPATARADLGRALELLPNETRFAYHLALLIHRSGDLTAARTAYAELAALAAPPGGWGIARGLAEIEHDSAVTLESLSWLSPSDRNALAPVAALLRSQFSLLSTLESTTDQQSSAGPAQLWQGLAALAQGEVDRARELLAPPTAKLAPETGRLPATAAIVRDYYYGLAVAISGDTDLALNTWAEAARLAVARGGEQSALPGRLPGNLSFLTVRHVRELIEAGRWDDVLLQVNRLLAITPRDTTFLQLGLAAVSRMAVAAQLAGDWRTAYGHWSYMQNALAAHPELGSPEPVWRAVAIAAEKLEDWEVAARAWDKVLDSLPGKRRASKSKAQKALFEPPPLGGVDPELQRPWLRNRIVENYRRAGRPDLAVAYFKQLLKDDPNNVELRLEMVTALYASDQTKTASRELQNLLKVEPNNVAALVLLATIQQDERPEEAVLTLARIMDIDPGNEIARKGLVALLLEGGQSAFDSDRLDVAQKAFERALEYEPNHVAANALLGEVEFELGNEAGARHRLETVLSAGTGESFGNVLMVWIRLDKMDEARQVMARAAAAGADTPELLTSIGAYCMDEASRSYEMDDPFAMSISAKQQDIDKNPWMIWGRELVAQGLKSAPNRADVLRELIPALGPYQTELAVDYARQLVALEPDEPTALMILGTAHALNSEVEESKKSFKQAERMALQQGDVETAERAVEMRRELSSPLFGLLNSVRAASLNDFDDPFDDPF